MESEANLPITTSTPDSDHTTHKTNKSFDDVTKELSYIDVDSKNLPKSDTSNDKDQSGSKGDTSDVPVEDLTPISQINSDDDDDKPPIVYDAGDINLTDNEAILMNELERELKDIKSKKIKKETKITKCKRAIEKNTQMGKSQNSSFSEQDYDDANESLIQQMNDLDLSATEDSNYETELKEPINTHMEVILNMITDPIPKKKYNEKNDAFGRTYANAFEVFITALLGEMDHDKKYEISGKADDKGADIKVYKNYTMVEVCQVKLGSYFEKGKGNAIVLQLVGTCVLFGVKKGIIISSEKRTSLTIKKQKKLNEIIDEIAKTKEAIQIGTFFMEEIEEMLKDDNVRKAFMIEYFNSAMPKKSKTNVTFVIPCGGCDKTWEWRTQWSIRTKIYEMRRKMRDRTGYTDTDLYKHIVETKHEINWAKADDIIEKKTKELDDGLILT